MLHEINAKTIAKIKNPTFKDYANMYNAIFHDFLENVTDSGLEIDEDYSHKVKPKLKSLKEKGAIFRNNDKSIYINWISPACEACRQGIGTATYYISLMCHRNCYYCFNKNQEDYEYYRRNKKDIISELEKIAQQNQKISYLALTGGEPLLHNQEMFEFFQFARKKFPNVHTRLYLSGEFIDRETLEQLKSTELNEIRFSIKMEDNEEERAEALKRIAMAKEYIPYVMVEMPVIPGELERMKDLLVKLDEIVVDGINLLEFCFPFNNVKEFKRRGFKIKNPPFKILYNYWYAGGLPISQSELDCLDLMDFAIKKQLKMGIHYCSLENKHTGQIYQQNKNQRDNKITYFSPKDYFLKTAKVFGDDISQVLKVFNKKGMTNYQYNDDYQFLEFHVKDIKLLKKLNVEVGISYNILENREDGSYLRELKVDLVYPKTFNINLI